MKWLINYIRQCFCKHELRIEESYVFEDEYDTRRIGTKFTFICGKCGYFRVKRNY